MNVEQPPGFEQAKFSNHIFELSRVLYGLKQAPRAWDERFSGFYWGFKRGIFDANLFIKSCGDHLLVMQMYIDDIIFDAKNKNLCKDFSSIIQKEFEMSITSELNFFLGLQIHQTKEGTFINQAKYSKKLFKRFGMEDTKQVGPPICTSSKLDMDNEGTK